MIRRRKKKSTATQKVKNATPNIYNGIHFKSKLETYCYKELEKHNLEANYEPIRFTIIEPFQYNGEKIRAMTFLPDYVGKGFIIECKGMITDSFPLRWKMFKKYLHSNGIQYDLYLPRNQKQVKEVIQTILEKRKLNERT